MRQKLRHTAKLVVLVLAFSAALNLGAKKAHAGVSPWDALTAVGISAGAGAVLGLSTIAFYAEPTKHMNNVLIGAGLGVIVGVGVAAYMVATADQQDEIEPEELLIDMKSDKDKKKDKGKDGDESDAKDKKKTDKKNEEGRIKRLPRSLIASHVSSIPAGMANPKSMNLNGGWAVGMNVLELRF